MFKQFLTTTSVAALFAFGSTASAAPLLTVDQIWENTPPVDITSEIVAYDAATNLVFVAAGDQVDVINFSTGLTVDSLTFDSGVNGGVNSVAVSNGTLAVAVAAPATADPGKVFLYDTGSLGAPKASVDVGVLPDMLTFTPDGMRILVANEGEPEGYDPGDVDPVGSISVIDTGTLAVQEIGFTSLDGQETALRDKGVRIFGPGASASQDLEPEYIAISEDGETAYVALQENNAFAIVDLTQANPDLQVEDIVALGFKDYGALGNEIDASDDDGVEAFVSQPGVVGMYQPDGIDTITIGGTEYIVSANEGDARDYDGFGEEERVNDNSVVLAPGAFDSDAKDDDKLGRLEITTAPGITDDAPGLGIDILNANGEYETLFSYGGRSFSLWNEDGTLAFDSGSFVEQALADMSVDLYPDGRSDAKGAEPEAVEVGVIDGRTYLFLGLERASAIMIFDLTDFDLSALTEDMLVSIIFDDSLERPEGLNFISAAESGDGFSYLLAAYEGSDPGVGQGTALFRLTQVAEPASLTILGMGLLGLGITRRRKARI